MSVAKGIDVTCPYCGHKERMIQDREGKQLVFCYPEEGGCDREFVVDFIFTIEAEVYTLEPVRDDEDAQFVYRCWKCKDARPPDESLCPHCSAEPTPF